MTELLPVRGTMFFLQPVGLDQWRGEAVAGIVGVMRLADDGSYEVMDAFEATAIPSADDLVNDPRFGLWYAHAGHMDRLFFDVFPMPRSHRERRLAVLDLLLRSCGNPVSAPSFYANVG